MLNCTTEKIGEEKVMVRLSGEITVQNASQLHKVLLDLLDDAPAVEIELGNIERADMSFFQLLCSAHRTYTAKDKILCVTGNKNKVFEENAGVGYVRNKGCSNDKFKNCVLMKEK